MSEKIYQPILGSVQQFPDQDEVITAKDVAGKTVREFFIRSQITQKTAKVAVWDNIAPDLELKAGDFVSIEAVIQVNGDFTNITARSIAVVPALENAPDDRAETKRKPGGTKQKQDVAF